MEHDLLNILYFYRSYLGTVTKRIIAKQINQFWQSAPNSLFGIGYTDTFLDDFHKAGSQCTAMMPMTMGGYARNGLENYTTVLVNDICLPLKKESIKNILCIHMLEHTPHPELFLQEVYNVMAPEGEMILIIPNRHGSWSQADTTPFGNGRPFSRNQIQKMLKNTGFVILNHSHNLFITPNSSKLSLYNSAIIENIGKLFLPRYSGIHIIRVLKRIYVPPRITEKKELVNLIGTLPDFIPSAKPIRNHL